MDKSKIANKKFTVGKKEEEVEVTIYSWLTQDEEDEYQTIITGNADFEQDVLSNDNNQSMTIKVSTKNLHEGNKFLLESYLITPIYEDFNIMSPEMREEIREKIMSFRDKKK